jgi:hypothetical protein
LFIGYDDYPSRRVNLTYTFHGTYAGDGIPNDNVCGVGRPCSTQLFSPYDGAVFIDHDDCFIWAVLNADRKVPLNAQITFGGNPFLLKVRLYNTEGAAHNTHPATNTLVLVVEHPPGFLVPVQGSRQAGHEAWCIIAVSALKCE